ncbi:MAG: hypothetical protein QOJ29_865 [Thermoleophilaceae bacterium]|nr:hypothetical protein [Thermoleophilaceae bacterium]
MAYNDAMASNELEGAYRLAFDEAVRALQEQGKVLDGLRTRSGIVLSAAAIVTSFLGGQALTAHSPSIWTWLAIGAFVGLALGLLVILWPRQDWAFEAVPRQIIGTYIEASDPLPLPQIHRDLAIHMEDSYVENEGRMKPLFRSFRVSSLLLMAEISAWIVDLAR